MSHAALVWANLQRRPLQSLLALACATVVFAIYGVMFGVLASFRHASTPNATFEQQLLTLAIVVSGVGMALILLLTAGAMSHAVRLRLHEFGVLKALGFSHRRIIALVLAEAAAPCVAGAALGLMAVPLLFSVLAKWLPPLATLPAPAYTLTTLAGALVIAVLVPALASVLPALRIVRVDAAAALTGSAEATPATLVEPRMRRQQGAATAFAPAHTQFFADTGAIQGLLRQIIAVTRIGYVTLPQRSRSAWLITVGVGCTTFALLWVLSAATGIHSAMISSGDPARVVLRSGATAWLHESRVSEGISALAARAPGVARAIDGSPLAEAVLHANVWPLIRRSNGKPSVIEMVGVGPHWREMTPSFRLVSGRLPKPGTHEVMVGRLAARALLGLDGGPVKTHMQVNRKITRDLEWQVVGTFTTGDWWDGYMVGDITALRQYGNGLTATAVFVRLDSPGFFDAFRSAVIRQLPPSITVEREADTYAAFWRSVLPKTLVSIAGVLIAMLAAGTVIATMQVTYSALEARRREIATLRVLGFDGRAAAVSILLEALPFALLGAWLGAGLVWLLQDGDFVVGAWSVVELRVDLHLVLVATGCAVAIAMIGTLPLAIRSLRRGEMDGLRERRGIDATTIDLVQMTSSPARRPVVAHAGAIQGWLRQIIAVTRIGFVTLPQRARSALLMAVGVACTTFVLLWFLSLAEGVRGAILQSGDPARVVLRDSSTRLLNYSRLPAGVEALAARAPGVARAADGSALAEAVLHAAMAVVRRSNGRQSGIEIIGVGPHWREMTPSFQLLSGRLPKPGTNEVMVGRLVPRALTGLDGGPLRSFMEVNRKEFHDVQWQVVGTFSTGDWQDGHVIGDIAVLRQYARGLTATAVFVTLDSPRSFDAFRSAVTRELPPSVTVEQEADTYAALWDAVPKTLLYVAYVLGALVATGAIMATMQVTHSALEARRREIATLRVLGFDGRAVAISILLEAIPFAVLGALVGAGVVWLWRRGDLWVGAGSVFEIGVDLHLVLVATCCAVAIAMIGTLPLAIRSLRRGEMDGLRDLREIEETVTSPASDRAHSLGWRRRNYSAAMSTA